MPGENGENLVRDIRTKEKAIQDAEIKKAKNADIFDPEQQEHLKKSETPKDIVKEEDIKTEFVSIEQKLLSSPLSTEYKEKIENKLGLKVEEWRHEIATINDGYAEELKQVFEKTLRELKDFNNNEDVREIYEVVGPYFAQKELVERAIRVEVYSRNGKDWQKVNDELNKNAPTLGTPDQIKKLQKVLGVDESGKIGPETMNGILKMFGRPAAEIKFGNKTILYSEENLPTKEIPVDVQEKANDIYTRRIDEDLKNILKKAQEFTGYLDQFAVSKKGHEKDLEEYILSLQKLGKTFEELVSLREQYGIEYSNKMLPITIVGSGNTGLTTEYIAIPKTSKEVLVFNTNINEILLNARRQYYLNTGDESYKKYDEESRWIELDGGNNFINAALENAKKQDSKKLDVNENERTSAEIGVKKTLEEARKDMDVISGLIVTDYNKAYDMAIVLTKKLGEIETGNSGTNGLRAEVLNKYPAMKQVFNEEVNFLKKRLGLVMNEIINNKDVKKYTHNSIMFVQYSNNYINSLEYLLQQIENGQSPSKKWMDLVKEEGAKVLNSPFLKAIQGSPAKAFIKKLNVLDGDSQTIKDFNLKYVETFLNFKKSDRQISEYTEVVVEMCKKIEGIRGEDGWTDLLGVGKQIVITAAAVAGAIAMGALFAATGGIAVPGVVGLLANIGVGSIVTGFGAAYGARLATATIEQDVDILADSKGILKDWAVGSAFSAGGGVFGSVVGTGIGRGASIVATRSTNTFAQRGAQAVSRYGEKMVETSFKVGNAQSTSLKDTIIHSAKNIATETGEELLEDSLQKVGEGMAPNNPVIGFIFSMIPSTSRIARQSFMTGMGSFQSAPGLTGRVSGNGVEFKYTDKSFAIDFMKAHGAPEEVLTSLASNGTVDIKINGVNIKVSDQQTKEIDVETDYSFRRKRNELIKRYYRLNKAGIKYLKSKKIKDFCQNDIMKFEALTEIVAGEKGIDVARKIIEMKDTYAGNMHMFNILIEVGKSWDGLRFIEALSETRAIWGKDPAILDKFIKAISSGEEGIRVLGEMHEIWKDDPVVLDESIAVLKYRGVETMKVLTRMEGELEWKKTVIHKLSEKIKRNIKHMYWEDDYIDITKVLEETYEAWETDPAILDEFIDIGINASRRDTIKALAELIDLRESNPDFWSKFIELGKNLHGSVMLALADVRVIWEKDPTIFDKLKYLGGDEIRALGETKAIWEKDPTIFDKLKVLGGDAIRALADVRGIWEKDPAILDKLVEVAKGEYNSIKILGEMSSVIGSNKKYLEYFISLRSTNLIGGISLKDYKDYQSLRGTTEDVFLDYLKYVISSKQYFDFTVENNLSEIFKMFPELDFSKEFNRENFLFALNTYSQIRIYGESSDITKENRRVVSDTIEKNKKNILKWLNDIRDRVLDPGSKPLSSEEKAVIKAIKYNGLPNLKNIDTTIEYIDMFLGEQNGPDIRTDHHLSLIKKFRSRGKVDKDINYSDNEYVSFYEKVLKLRESTNLEKILACFDELQENRQNFLFMQDRLLNSFTVVATLTKVLNEKGGKISTHGLIDKVLDDLYKKLKRDKDPSVQIDILKEADLKVQKILNNLFEQGMGLKNLPEVTPEIMDHLYPFLTYYSNINNTGDTKVDILSLFVLLKISGKWDDFKQGKDIDIEAYLDDSVRDEITNYLKDRKALDIFEAGNKEAGGLQIPVEKESEWMSSLNEKTEGVLIGESANIVDTLNQIRRNSEELMDTDGFSNEEKILFSVVSKHGQKNVGRALASKFRDESYSDEIIKELQFPESVSLKEILPRYQKIAKIIGALAKFSETINDADIPGQIESLNAILLPSSEVVAIYKKIGEEMGTDSGVHPINEDVEYLESVLHKKKESLTEEEFTIAQNYIESVKAKVLNLYSLRDRVLDEFEGLDKAIKQTDEISDTLKSRFQEFKKLFMIEPSERQITLKSTMTGDLEDVIPQIRQCLGCQTNECNNDTNLTFGDRNRFSVITREFHMPESKSLSDQLVTLQITADTAEGSEKKYSFLMDNVYGARDRDILISNVLVVMNKLRKLKAISPKTNIDVFVTDAALSSCGVTAEYLKSKIDAEFGRANIRAVSKKVIIAESASGDGHYEIGGGFNGRVSKGEGVVNGIEISL